jgi:tetratricopeptide (TPR) repeat protein
MNNPSPLSVTLWLSFMVVCACGPDDAVIEARIDEGKRLYNMADYAGAIEVLSPVIDDIGNNIDAQLHLGLSLLYVSRHGEAQEVIDQALANHPSDARLYEALGIIYLARYTARAYTETQREDGEAAIAALQKAIELDPDRVNPHYNLGVIYTYKDNIEPAQQAFEAALAIDSTFAAAHKRLGMIHRQRGFRQEAVTALENAVRYTPNDSESRFTLGLAYRDMRMYDPAVESLERAAELNPLSPKIRLNLANMYMRVGRREEGRLLMQEAEDLRQRLGGLHTEATPPQGESLSIGTASDHYHLALAHSMAGRVDEAIVEFRRSLGINPDQKDANTGLGLMLLEQHQPESALTYLQRAVELDPQDPVTLMRLGWAHEKMESNAKAQKAFEEAVALDSSLVEGYTSLARIVSADGEHKRAIALLRRAIELRPNGTQAHFNLGVAFVNSGDYSRAAQAYERVIELNPGHTRAHLYLSDIYTKLGRASESKALERRARELTLAEGQS